MTSQPYARPSRRPRPRARAAAFAGFLAVVLMTTGCSSERTVTSAMDDTVGEVQERVGAVARDSGTVEELDRRLRDGESYTLMLLDASADDIRKTKPFPSTAVTALRSDEERVTLEVFSTGHGSRQTGWFGEESVNLVGCALVSAEPGGRTSVRGTRCSTAVQDVFREPWEEVRLRP